MPRDDLRNQEDNSGFIGGGEGPSGGVQNLGGGGGGGTGTGSPYGPELQHLNDEPEVVQQAAGNRLDDAKDEAKDRAIEEGKKRAKEGLKKSGERGAEKAGEGATRTASTGASGAAGEGGAAGTAGTGAAGAGTGAAGTTGAAGAAAAGEGAAGAAAAGAGAAGTAAAGTGAAAAGTGAVAAGTAGAAAGTGAVAGATSAGVATGAGVAATTGVETGGIGAVVGAAIVVIALVGGFVIKYRKEFAALSAILFVGALLLITALLNGLKPIASTLQTAQKYLSPVQQIVDNRSVEVIGRFITGGSGAALALDQQQKEQVAQTNTANAGGGQVLPATSDGLVTSGKLKTLFDAMKAEGLEEKLKQKYGLEFKAGGGGIQIVRYGQVIGTATSGREAAELLRIGFPDMHRMLNEDLPYWSWAQHNKGARNMKGQYNIPQLAIPGAHEAYDAGQLVEVVKYQMSTILKTGLTNMKRGIACFTGGTECNDLGVPVQAEAEPEYQNDNRSSISGVTQEAYDENIKNITPENGIDSPRLDTSTGQKVTERIGGKDNGQTVGLLGWLDIAATTRVMSRKEGAQQLPSILRGTQAGSLYLWNLSSVNQMLAKDMTSPAASLITRNYNDIESSQAYNYVAYDDATRGLGLSETQKINSKIKQAFSYFYESFIIENPIIQGAIDVIFTGWLVIHKSAAGTIIDIAATTPLGKFMERFAAWVLDQVGFLPFIENIVGMPSRTLLPVCDPADKSYNFFNCMASGARNASNFMCAKYFGCGTITLAQENELKIASARDMNARLAAMPLHKRLFDQKVPNSFINVAAMNSPLPIKSTNNMASMFQGIFSVVWGAPSKVASLTAAPARAASADASLIDGQDAQGIPLNTIQEAPLASELTNDQGICPESKLGEEVNMCMADSSTVDVMIAFHLKDPAYGTNQARNDATAPAAAGNAAQLATEILQKVDAGTITFLSGGAKQDLIDTKAGKKVTNQCGGNVDISAEILHVINEAGKKYRFMITSLNSDHECGGYHPEGKAVDFDLVAPLGQSAVKATTSTLGGAVWKGFATDIAGWITAVAKTGGLGQVQCMGRLNVPSTITQAADTCHHLHVSVNGRPGTI